MNNKILFYTLYIILVTSCSEKFHPFTSNNITINEFNTHFYNDSIKLSLSFPGDVEIYSDSLKYFLKSFKKNNKYLNKIKANNIVFRGRTIIPPFYDFLFIESGNEFTYSDNIDYKGNHMHILQSKYGKNHYVLISRGSKKSYSNMVSDQQGAFKTIQYGDGYISKIPENPFDIIINQLYKDTHNNYLNAYKKLYNVRNNYITERDNFSFQQAMLTASSMIIDSPVFDSLNFEYNSKRALKINSIDSFIRDSNTYIDKEARNKILEIADSSRILMFNELHWDRSSRLFLNSTLTDFNKLGYKYLAIEALSDIDSSLTKLNYPTKSSGFYILEPSMADLIRLAKSLGFTLISYDSQGEDREKNQATNIYEDTFGKDKNAKVLVYAGVGHIHEKSDGVKRMMAAEFNRLFNINPVTFDIHLLSMNRELMKKAELILVSDNDILNWANPTIKTDFYLGIKETSKQIFQNTIREKYQINDLVDSVKENTSPLYSQLYMKSEFDKTGIKSIPLYNHWGINTEYRLEKGEYKWFIINALGDILQEKDIYIK